MSRHRKNEIAEALDYCWDTGMAVEEIHRSHRWDRVVCPGCGEHRSIPSTPRVPEDYAKRFRTFADRHLCHVQEGE